MIHSSFFYDVGRGEVGVEFGGQSHPVLLRITPRNISLVPILYTWVQRDNAE